ncbi:MAG: DUF3800 domain-containing protein [Paludibacter sp.]
MAEFFLFLDESNTHSYSTNPVFCMAGIIVSKDDYYNILSPRINQLKSNIWSDLPNPTDIIFHQKDIRDANRGRPVPSEFGRFRRNVVCRQLYTELNNILNLGVVTVVGSSIVMDTLNSFFNQDILSDEYLIGMQILLENYCHFLNRNNGIGYVFYESRGEHQDKNIRMRYNLIKAMGSMYINSYAMQRLLRDIEFPNKTGNVLGLQLADFIPNDFARQAAGFSKQKFSIYDISRTFRYNGGIPSKENRFGVKVMP